MMSKRATMLTLAVGGLLVTLSGCTAMVSDNRPPPGRWAWGRPGPRLEVIADTGIQFVVDADEDVFVLGGVWYRHVGGAWYSTRTYGGQWAVISQPPAAFYRIPPGHAKYRVVGGRAAPAGPKEEGKDDESRPGRGHGRNK